MPARIAEVVSPCVNVCTIEQKTGLCRGCLRTLDEIGGWLEMTAEEKRALLLVLDQRRAAKPFG